MAFVTIPGITGKIFVPEESPERLKKHPCRDCFSCQMCDDARCELCHVQKQCIVEKPRDVDFVKFRIKLKPIGN